MGNGSANCGRLLGVARVSACWPVWRSSRRLPLSRRHAIGIATDSAIATSSRSRTRRSVGPTPIETASRTATRCASPGPTRVAPTPIVTGWATASSSALAHEPAQTRHRPRRHAPTAPSCCSAATRRSQTTRGLDRAPSRPIPASPTPRPAVDLPDLLPPETTITTGPAGTVANGTVSFSFTSSEEDSTFECRLDGSGWSDALAASRTPGSPTAPHVLRPRDRRVGQY